jgi:hypothetical protein
MGLLIAAVAQQTQRRPLPVAHLRFTNWNAFFCLF